MPSVTAAPTVTPELLIGQLSFATGSDRQVPADGVASATVEATLTDATGRMAARREIELRLLGNSVATISPASARSNSDGKATFAVASDRPGQAAVGLYLPGQLGQPLAEVVVEFTRKVVVLAPGFQSALARRFLIFGTPSECVDAGKPASISEALICLGYTPNAADDPLVGSPTPGATIVDMSWEPARCRTTDAAAAIDCVATISRTADGTDVLWQPAEYDLATLALSMARQSSVDAWARRLAETLRTYDAELKAASGTHASFYLVGHSLGGEVVVRALRAIVADPQMAAGFEAENRGRLQLALSIDGALNWTGGVDFGSGGACGIPVHTTADSQREADNVDAVEDAFDRLGTFTVAVTSSSDPVVGPEVALLDSPLQPQRGYFESAFDTAGGCGHSSLLWPEPGPPLTYPLNDLFGEYIGPAAGP